MGGEECGWLIWLGLAGSWSTRGGLPCAYQRATNGCTRTRRRCCLHKEGQGGVASPVTPAAAALPAHPHPSLPPLPRCRPHCSVVEVLFRYEKVLEEDGLQEALRAASTLRIEEGGRRLLFLEVVLLSFLSKKQTSRLSRRELFQLQVGMHGCDSAQPTWHGCVAAVGQT